MPEVLPILAHLVIVALCREPRQPFLVHIDPKRVDACDPHINP